jgi:Ca2+-binding RTX toxin-like protein
MSLSASEQYLLELINRARLDPEAEAKRYGVDLNDGLSSGQIGTDSLQVLAPNAKLAAAAESHSEWMLSSNAFSHTGAASSNAGDRAQSAGYTFNGAWAWRENLAWVGSTGDVNLEKAILEHHEGLYRSESHRVNIFGANVREIGVAQVAGNFTHQGTTYNSSMLTEVFAKSGTDVFVTGVAYRDTDRDNFYSIGEGQSGIRVWTGVTAATTTSAGGYSVSVSSQDAVSLTVSDGDSVLGHLRVNTSDGNVKLDVVTDRYGNLFYDLSGSATLQDGILEGRLLGLDDLSLSGERGRNLLYGNDGNNTMDGGRGHDRLWGQAGDDILSGANGRDKLRGGQGEDILSGNSGRDELYGNRGDDELFGGDGKDELSGNRGDDMLYGGKGYDVLRGGGGSDELYGGNWDDRLFGGSGNDWIDGGSGNDVMKGGGGADTFVFGTGEDRIKDFADDTDTIAINADLARGMNVSDVLGDAHVVNGDAVLDFGGGHMLIVEDVSNLDILANDLIII